MTSPRVFQAQAVVFLHLLGATASDEMLGEWLAGGQGEPAEGRAAWTRDKLGLSAFECERLAGTFSEALDDARSGIANSGAAFYVVVNGPRGPVRFILHGQEDGKSLVQVVDVELGRADAARVRIAWKRTKG